MIFIETASLYRWKISYRVGTMPDNSIFPRELQNFLTGYNLYQIEHNAENKVKRMVFETEIANGELASIIGIRKEAIK